MVKPRTSGANPPGGTISRRDLMQVGAGALSLGVLGQLGRATGWLEAGPERKKPIPTARGNPNRHTPVVAQPRGRQSLVSPSPGRPSGIVPPEASTRDWDLLWVDDFDGPELVRPRWGLYDGTPRPGLRWSPTHAKLEDSQIVLQTYQDPAFHGAWVSAGMTNSAELSQTYGKYEVCYRIDRGRGVSHCMLLWPKWPDSGPPEIDFAEDNGQSRSWVQGTVHWRDRHGAPAEDMTIVEVDTTEWHVLGVEWSPDTVRFTVDGAAWKTVRGRDVPSSPMALCMQTQTWGRGSAWEAPDPTDGTRVNLFVDWVAVYSHRA